MVKRPTIRDVANQAGVSVSTINRIIKGGDGVRPGTTEMVRQVAAEIGFYGLGTLDHAVRAKRRRLRVAVLLQQRHRVFYRLLGEAFERASATFAEADLRLELDYLSDLSSDQVAGRIADLGQRNDALAVVAAEHPLVSDAIDRVLELGKPVAGLITPLSARGPVGYIGLDNWKVGRTAAWAFDRFLAEPTEIAILVGNHRYRNQELNESGFRSYFREHERGFTLLEPRATFESAAAGRQLTENLLRERPDLGGLFVSGGGITGALAALRDGKPRPGFVTVGYELFEATRTGLLDGTLTLVIAHPIERLAQTTLQTLHRAQSLGVNSGAVSQTLDFELYTSQNL